MEDASSTPWHITLVFFKLIVNLKSWQTLEKTFHEILEMGFCVSCVCYIISRGGIE